MPGQGRPPARKLKVLFCGAGASKAAELPLTEELLERIYPRSGPCRWHKVRTQKAWAKDLAAAVRLLYPSADAEGYRPSVADFFTVLEVVASVHGHRERMPIDALPLLRDLRLEIALGLQDAVADDKAISATPHYDWLADEMRPDVVITSNWDTLIERAALQAGRVVRYRWPTDPEGRPKPRLAKNETIVLKLHGSVDWGKYEERSVTTNPLADYYSTLGVAVDERERFPRAKKKGDAVLRFRSLEGAADEDARKVGFRSPLMATMAVGKQADIDRLDGVWNDAYWCLSRARRLAIVGYSMPPDDLELRTLLRVTSRRAGKARLDEHLDLTVYNPSPEAHDRARAFLGDGLESIYLGAKGLKIFGG